MKQETENPLNWGFYYFANIALIHQITHSTHFVCMIFRSEGFDIKPSSMRSQNIFISLIAPSLPNRVCTSDFTPRHFNPVIRVYSCWYWIASHLAQLLPSRKNVVTPVAIGEALSRCNSKYACSCVARAFTQALRAFISSFSGTLITLNHGIPRFTISSMIFLLCLLLWLSEQMLTCHCFFMRSYAQWK